MKLSIITVVRNAETTIEGTIISVINQTFQDYEYIIIDGLSTDSTNDIINKYRENIDVYVSEKDAGIYDAMNKAVDLANGEWIYILGADDILYSKDTLSEFFSNDFLDAEVVYGDVIFKNSRKVFAGEFDNAKMCLFSPCHQSVFYKKSVIIKYGYFNIRYKINADYDLHIKTFTDGVQWKYFNQIISIFNDTGVSSLNQDIEFNKINFKVSFDRFVGKVDKNTLAKICFISYLNFLKAHSFKEGFRYLILILKYVGLLTWVKIFFIRINENKKNNGKY